MSLSTPIAIRTLQRKLYRKAKAEPAFRFYLLYDKIYREDILRHAYALARANAGAPGVDGKAFAAIEASGLEKWLAGLREELILKTYRPDPVRRCDDPKAGWRRATTRHSTHPGSGCANCRQACAGTDLRGRLRGQCLRLPPRSRCGGRSQGSAPADRPGLHRRGRRRSVPLLRLDPARRAYEIGGSSHRGPARAPADQAVAESADRGTGRQRRDPAHRWWQEQHARHASGRRREPTARQHLHEPVLEVLTADRVRASAPSARHRVCRRLCHP